MLAAIKEVVRLGKHRFTVHALERCLERDIAPEEISLALLYGEEIEQYPKDKYGPSCLVCGTSAGGRILHVHCSINPVWIITAYDPTLNPTEWENDFKKRRRLR